MIAGKPATSNFFATTPYFVFCTEYALFKFHPGLIHHGGNLNIPRLVPDPN